MKKEIENYSCCSCKLFVAFDTLVIVKGKPYHTDCFICSLCQERLHISERPIIRKGKFFCKHCSRSNQSRMKSPFVLLSRSIKRTTSSNKIRSRSASAHDTRKSSAEALEKGQKYICIEPGYDLIFPQSLVFDFDEISRKVKGIRKNYFSNLMARTLSDELLHLYSTKNGNIQKRIYRCISSGLASPHTPIGCLIMNRTDFDDLSDFFIPLVKNWNEMHPKSKLVARNDIRYRYQFPFTREYAFKNWKGVKVGQVKGFNFNFYRNLSTFPLIGSMSVVERKEFESHLLPVLKRLCKTKYGGDVIQIREEILEEKSKDGEKRLTKMSLEEYFQYRKTLNPFSVEKKCFKLSSCMKGTSIAANFPHSSGVYVSSNRIFRIFYNQEDHLRFELYTRCHACPLAKIYGLISNFLSVFEKCYEEEYSEKTPFLVSKQLGHIVSCPGRLGAGFTASLFLNLPELYEQDSLRHLSRKLRVHFLQDITNEEKCLFSVKVIPKILETEEMMLSRLYRAIPKILLEEKFADAI